MKNYILRQIAMLSKWTFYGLLVQLIFTGILVAADGQAQSVKSVRDHFIKIELKNNSILEAFNKIEQKTGYNFAYEKDEISNGLKLNKKYNGKIAVSAVLLDISEEADLRFRQVNKSIIVSEKKNNTSREQNLEVIIDGITITGKVTGEEDGLPGVNVIVKGTSNGTVTDVEGNYSLEVPDENTVLVFSYVGYIQEEVAVGAQSVINLSMVPDVTSLEEIVVIGYGTSKKEDLVSSVSQVKADVLQNQPTVRVDQALQGRAAGVEITAHSGVPGGESTIRIRGTSSINGNNNPLFVIDGFIAGTEFNLNNLNVNDIESIEVLKDATALSIYGTRGAAGVILITSKSGKNLSKGKTQVSINQYFSYQQTANSIELADSKLFAEYRNEEAQFVPGPDGFGYTDPTLPIIFEDPASAPYTDWIDLVSQNGMISNTDLSVSGNTDKNNYYISFNHFNQDGVVRGSGIERFSLRTNLDFKLSKMFKTGIRLNISRFKKENNKVSYGEVIRNVVPIRTVYDEEGNFTNENPVSATLQRNPEADIQMRTDHDLVTNLITNAYLEFQPTKDLVIRSTLGVELNNFKNNQYLPGELPRRKVEGVGGFARIRTNNGRSVLNENTITYGKEIGAHSVKVLGGFTIQKISNESTDMSAEGFPNDVLEYNNMAFGSDPLLNIVGSGYLQRTFTSFLGRINYSYKSKYLLTVVGRYDGSSVFETGNKYAFFPSVGAAWNVDKEDFMAGSDAISRLKLRGSYGIIGEQGVVPYNSLAKFNSSQTYFNETLVPAVLIGGLPSKDLTWETTKQFDIGLEIGFLNNRISLETDFYNKTTEDLLLAKDLPGTAGGTQLQNVGSVENKGFEVNITSVNIIKGDFAWETTLTVSANRSKVLDLGGDDYINLDQAGQQAGAGMRLIPGETFPSFVGATYLGTYKTEQEIIDDGREGVSYLGAPRYVDLDGNGVINDEDKIVIGSPQPDYYGGFRNYFNYKGLSLDVFFHFSYGNDMYSKLTHDGWFGRGDRVLVPDVANRWIEGVNETSDVPRAGTSTSLFNPNSTVLLQDASFIRLKGLSLGYDLPVVKWGIDNIFSRLNVYAAGNNLLLFTEWTMGDPEVSNYGNNNLSQGFATGQYPYARTYTLGVNIDF